MPDTIRIKRRLHAKGEWVATSAIHIGSGDDRELDVLDMVLLRDSVGRPFIPGSSLAGCARNAMTDLEAGPALQVLFGGEKDKDYASVVTFHDAFALNGTRPCIRDGVRIDPDSGTAAAGSKFDMEVLPAGTRFQIVLSLQIYNRLPGGIDEDELVSQFHALLTALSSRDFRVGARTSRGLGAGSVESWRVYSMDMDNPDHVRAWLLDKPEEATLLEHENLPAASNASSRFRISAKLAVKTSILIRSVGESPFAPDFIHISENGVPVIPGASLAGVLRHRCRRIAKTLDLERSEELITDLFGPHGGRQQKVLWKSRVRVTECSFRSGAVSRQVQSRVQIDRFTGGAHSGALFDEAPVFPEAKDWHVELEIDVCDSKHAPSTKIERALILLAFKDLWLGDLALGGELSVGRGVLEGVESTFRSPDGAECSWRRGAGQPPSAIMMQGDTNLLIDLFAGWPVEAAAWQPTFQG